MAKKSQENYFDKVPSRPEKFRWHTDKDNLVVVEVDNKGFFNRLLQVIAKKPKVSYIHLDELGSFVWQSMDGKNDITKIGVLVEEHFGEKAHPVYERLVKYFVMLQNAGFVEFKK